ncbi:hypothetical protein HK405_010527 [Cladochytrium tenue]|nr:hypothetical protein HK405_010527 [Cladochytrium tenue]
MRRHTPTTAVTDNAASAAQANDAASGADASGPPGSSASGSVAVNATAAATWSAADHNSRVHDRDRDRYFGAAEAFEDSLYVLPADADEKTRLHMQVW